MSTKNNRNTSLDNSNKRVQPGDQQGGIQNMGKNSRTGRQPGNNTLSQGQGTVAGSTGTGNQGKTGNPVSGK